MAHFARVIDGKVVAVHVLANEVITDKNGIEHEEWGQRFLAQLHGYHLEELVQCSYNSNFRGNYPGPGFTYDFALDAFIEPKPFESWILNNAYQWTAPLPYPEDGATYSWDEQAGDWVEVA